MVRLGTVRGLVADRCREDAAGDGVPIRLEGHASGRGRVDRGHHGREREFDVRPRDLAVDLDADLALVTVRKSVSEYDDSLEREFRILGVQLSRVSQSFHALADAYGRIRAGRVPSRVPRAHARTGEQKEDGADGSLPFPKEPFA